MCYELFQKNECIMNCYLKIMYLQIGLPMEENFSSYSVMTLPSISAGITVQIVGDHLRLPAGGFQFLDCKIE